MYLLYIVHIFTRIYVVYLFIYCLLIVVIVWCIVLYEPRYLLVQLSVKRPMSD